MVWPLKRISLVRHCVLTLHVYEPNSIVLFWLSICRILNLIFKMGIGLTCKAKKLFLRDLHNYRGWSGGTMVLGKLPVPGRPTIWITVGQGPTALAVGAGEDFYSRLSLLSSFSLSLGDVPI